MNEQELLRMRRKPTAMKISIIMSGLKHWQIAELVNQVLPEEQKLSEHAVTRIVTERKKPTIEQAVALAAVLSCETADLFSDDQILS